MQLNLVVPALYKKILSSKVLDLNVTETKATCDNCLRSRDKRFSYTYKSNLKCCTFHPYMPNFAVGALLTENKTSVGLTKIQEKIKNHEFNLPIGLIAPFEYQFKFLTKEETDFGNDEALLCPYFDQTQNQCSIWTYRGVVCTTYFCRSDSAQAGQKFWAVLSDYLSYVEMALAEECLIQLDFSPRDLSDQLFYLNKHDFETHETSQKYLTTEVMKPLWNGYTDYVEFYKKCFAITKKIDRNQFKEILGQQGLQLEQEVIEYAHRR